MWRRSTPRGSRGKADGNRSLTLRSRLCLTHGRLSHCALSLKRGGRASRDRAFPSTPGRASAIACDAFAGEPQALGNGATARVQDAALDGHPVQAQIVEQVVQQALAATRDDALTPVALLDPVADVAIAVGPVDWVAADRAGESAVDPEAALWPAAAGELLAHLHDEVPQVVGRRREIHPRQPLAQVSAIAFHHGEDRLGIGDFE